MGTQTNATDGNVGQPDNRCPHTTTQRCTNCKRCFTCIGERPRWWRKAVFEVGYFCGSCAPSSDCSYYIFPG
jgi:hypothetical protein